jgi:hypothetical protein
MVSGYQEYEYDFFFIEFQTKVAIFLIIKLNNFFLRKVPSKRRCQKQNVNKNCLGPKQLKEVKNHEFGGKDRHFY